MSESHYRFGNTDVRIFSSKDAMGAAAASLGAERIRQALAEHGEANIVVATGASQFETLANLVGQPEIDWHRVTAFHLDEYVGLPIEHPASFRRYLWTRFARQLPLPLRDFHYIDADGDVAAECVRLGLIIESCRIDVAFIGIGENGHLAFNDPPADFSSTKPYLVVELDQACRQQQYGEGWFPSLEEVPTHAISMSISSIMKCRSIICSVPDSRKAEAVGKAINGEITPTVPASILQRHKDATILLDEPAAAQLSRD